MLLTLEGGFQVFSRLCAALLRKKRGPTIATSTALQFNGTETSNGAAVTPSLTCKAHGRMYSTLARRTSLMAQFQRVKAQFPDHLLLFQVGDFYEIYGNDASKQVGRESDPV